MGYAGFEGGFASYSDYQAGDQRQDFRRSSLENPLRHQHYACQSCRSRSDSLSGNAGFQIGDRVMVVGPENAIEKVAAVLGNSLKKLREPNLVTIFVGIALGVLLGSIPLLNVPQPVAWVWQVVR